jgi:hypothetical protein
MCSVATASWVLCLAIFFEGLSCHFWVYRWCLMHPNICLIVYRYASFSHMLVRTNISQVSAGDGIWTQTFAKQISGKMYNVIADSWGHWSTPNEITEPFPLVYVHSFESTENRLHACSFLWCQKSTSSISGSYHAQHLVKPDLSSVIPTKQRRGFAPFSTLEYN